MSAYNQSRTFVKQVQEDLLALCDADLIRVVHQWVDVSNPSEVALAVPEDTRLALGYTRILAETGPLSPNDASAPGAGSQEPAQWDAPSPQRLRTLLAAMDLKSFDQHIITYAFKSLHAENPDWLVGGVFNAHLAYYLRLIREGLSRRKHSSNPLAI